MVVNLLHAEAGISSQRYTYFHSLFFPCSCSDVIFHQAIGDFIYRISELETNAVKREKLKLLKLTLKEWKRVERFLQLLKVSQALYS